jgi:spore coat polysaccharide biosynthesis protein SpsF
MIGAIIQSRIDSQRLPGKALMDIAGKPMIQHVIERALMIEGLDLVVVAIPKEDFERYVPVLGAYDPAINPRIKWYLGERDNVLSRFEGAARMFDVEHVMRITGDCPLLCPLEAGRVLRHYLQFPDWYKKNLFVTNDTNVSGTNDGFDVEVFPASFLSVSASNVFGEEHVTPHIKELCEVAVVKAEREWPKVKLSVDTQEDLDRVRRIFARLPDGEYSMAATMDAWQESRDE